LKLVMNHGNIFEWKTCQWLKNLMMVRCRCATHNY